VLGLVAGCAGLPDEGSVEVGEGQSSTSSVAPFDFNPPEPEPGASQEQIVAGFLRALQATPVGTRVATQFLTSAAAADWHPDDETVVYASHRLRRAASEVVVELDDAFRLDATGSWDGPAGGPTGSTEVTLRLAREDGEWRISDLPDAMIIPQSHFTARYRAYSLYFFDPSGSVLVPEPVYLPWGVQAPTLLVSGLLAGPGSADRAVERSFFPRSTRLGVSVPVSQDGVAQVPLTKEVGDLDEDDLERVLAQLAWTLRQVDEVGSIQLVVDGTPLDLPSGGSTADVDGWGEYTPALASASTDLFGLRGRRVVQEVSGEEIVAGTLAGSGLRGPRSLGVNITGQRFAVVSADGRRAVVLGRAGAEDAAATTAYDGVDLLRPMWDLTDRLWLVDRTAPGAAVLVETPTGFRRLRAPGLGPGRVAAATLSRDGTRLVLAISDPDGDGRLVMHRVVRTGNGTPVRLGHARTIASSRTVGRPMGQVQGLAWRDPTTIAVLLRPTSTTSEVLLISPDGSAGFIELDASPDVLFDVAVALTASPGGPTALVVATRSGRLHALDATGRWDLDAVEAGLRAPAFVG
jgi:hypothetical protein